MQPLKFPRPASSNTRDNDDRLSNLPDAIIHHIFSFVDTVDVVRTSALSRKWRYYWTSVPYLHFDFQTTWKDPLRLWGTINEASDKFREFVNWVLLFQNRTTGIRRFFLSAGETCDKDTIFRWLIVAAQRNVQELELNLTFVSHSLFQLPLALVALKSLKVLKLNMENCSLKLPKFTCLSRLKSLVLMNFELLDGDDVVENFVSSCPVLEDLKIEASLFRSLKVLHIRAARLKCFKLVEYCDVDSAPDGLCKIELEVVCPNLESFIYIGNAVRNVSLQQISSLEKAFISLTAGPGQSVNEIGCIMRDMATKFLNVKVLKLYRTSLWFFAYMFANLGGFSTLFYNLKILKLLSYEDEDQYQGIICLLKCSPNLENLIIDFDEPSGLSEDIQMKDETIACLTTHLKVVQLNYVEGTENELELIRFLLKNGHVLEKIVVAWWGDLKEIRETLQKVKEFPRSSSNVELEFIRCGSYNDLTKFYEHEV